MTGKETPIFVNVLNPAEVELPPVPEMKLTLENLPYWLARMREAERNGTWAYKDGVK